MASQRGGGTEIWQHNILDRYWSQPPIPLFEDMCLADFAAGYRLVPKKHGNDTVDDGDDDIADERETEHMNKTDGAETKVFKEEKTGCDSILQNPKGKRQWEALRNIASNVPTTPC